MSADWSQLDPAIAQMTPQEKRRLARRLNRELHATLDEEPPYDADEAIRLVREIIDLPIEGPDDGFSGRDHDRVLYDQEQK